MAQEAIQEIDMDVFSRRIGPYFSWLESKIESGWVQSDHITKDVLKETKYLATTMRARFILGVSRQDFAKEVERTLELFQLASDAFQSESDEIETKQNHFIKGISEELGPEFLPGKTKAPVEKIEPQVEPVVSEKPVQKIVSKPKKVKVESVVQKQVKVKKAKKSVKKEKKQVEKVSEKPKIETKVSEKHKKKGFSFTKWLKEAFFGEDLD
jgi:hypothetical protein